jgi:hypothetical protein
LPSPHGHLEVVVITIGSAVSLTEIDVTYVALRRISTIDLLDAAAEAVLIVGWLIVSFWHKALARDAETGSVAKT